MKVLFLTNVPAPYRVDFFNELGKYCDLTVTYEMAHSDERDASWEKQTFINYEGIIMKGVRTSVESSFCPEIIKYVKDKSFSHIIVSNINSLTTVLAILYMRMHGIKYYIESDGAFASRGNVVKHIIKKLLISGATGLFSTSEECDKYYLLNGATKEKIYRYPFTSVTEMDLRQAGVIDSRIKKKLKEKLEVIEEHMVLSVGRFSYNDGYGKGFDALLKIAELCKNDIGFYIVGDEPTTEFIRLKEEKNLSNVHFIGFMNKEELSEYYAATDIFILLSRGDVWGLVINEAMAYGLPIISTTQCLAGTTLIKQNQNGFIVDIEDLTGIACKINSIIYSQEMLLKYGSKSFDIICDYTIEKMATRHLQILSGGTETKSI